MFDVTAFPQFGKPRFPTFGHNGLRCITSNINPYTNVGEVTYDNGVVYTNTGGIYKNETTYFFPNITREDTSASFKWLSRVLSSTGVTYVEVSTPTPVALKGMRIIGYSDGESRGSFRNGVLEYLDLKTETWKDLLVLGNVGNNQDTGVLRLNQPTPSNRFRLKMGAVIHSKNYYTGLRRFWLYV